MIGAIVNDLTASQQMCLKAASVVGRTFSYELLHRVYPIEVDRLTLVNDVAALKRLGFITAGTAEEAADVPMLPGGLRDRRVKRHLEKEEEERKRGGLVAAAMGEMGGMGGMGGGSEPNPSASTSSSSNATSFSSWSGGEAGTKEGHSIEAGCFRFSRLIVHEVRGRDEGKRGREVAGGNSDEVVVIC